jgi:glycine dehydrogenase subunit 1
MSLGVLEAPGKYGCALAIGEGQPAGNYLAYGGPHYGFLAARQTYARQLPGRIVGETVDLDDRRGFVLTLQTREQHIRREKATSNITSNQTLLALGGLVYLSWLGPSGLREVGERSHALADHARRRLGLPPAFDRPTLREFVVRTGRPAREVIAECKRRGVHPGYAIGRDYAGLDDALMMAFTERRTPAEIERLAEALAAVGVEVAA